MNDHKRIIELPLPIQFEKYNEETQYAVLEYLSELSIIQQKAYCIAKDHLGSSFNILKSNGYIEWKKDKIKNPKN